MKIQVTTSHTITFTVEAFWNEEGGMGQDQFGGEVKELAEAIRLLEMAKAHNAEPDWVIVARVKTNNTAQ
jgi:hypothetical protein